ncbi:MAG: TonB-dependent receptor [Acidobacteria bacterium]|nr:TonB-dependent receptor [Acidobacteriota bacterium]
MTVDVLKAGCKWVLLVSLVLLLPAGGYAQEATFTGAVTDSTGAVLPGVTITAVHEASGNTFTAVTDDQGEFRVPVRVGTYRITAELPGFTTVTRSLQILIGQTVPVNMQMAPSAVQETVTVTGEAPLVDVTGSTVGANIDPRQMQELPINGRNWMDLTLLAPGARRNEGGGLVQFRQGYSQTNVDGQQITINYHSQTDAEQVGFSRDAIAEFTVVANRFDATMGRSSGMIVNAVTKSGTNTFAGSVGGYFRSDRFNAKDHITNRVLDYSNQQVSLTFGGPIRRDRVHFFGAYEYEREPKTFFYTTPWPSFNVDQVFPSRVHKLLGRLDYQFTPQTRLSVRVSHYDNLFFGGGGATSHPSTGRTLGRVAPQYTGTFTQVLGSRAVNEIRAGATAYERRDQPIAQWKGGPFPFRPVLQGSPVTVELRGLTIGQNAINTLQDTAYIRDDFTTSYDWGGRHDVKLGGEYFRYQLEFRWCLRCTGQVDARNGPVPANIEALFPVWNDASTWNLAPLARITSQVFHGLSDSGYTHFVTRHNFAGWLQDDWRVGDNLTLNLGVRYDVDSNGHSEKLRFLPWLPGDQPHDTNNVAPRLGMNLRVSDRTVIRGGYGLFFAFSPNDGVQQTNLYQQLFEYQILNDGRPDFVPNWFGPGPSGEGEFGGPKPTMAQALQRACDVNFVPGCVRRTLNQEINYPGRRTSYSHQASAGIQRQIGDTMSVEANYVYTGGRLEEYPINVNLSYNPATGANYPFNDISRRPFPDWGLVNFEMLEGWSNYHGADFTWTKRYSNRWQATATYTLSSFKDATPVRDQWYVGPDGVVARRPVGFPLAPDLGGEYGYSGTYVAGGFGMTGDQRHRAVVNGLWELGYGFQVSGIYFFGSGMRYVTTTGVDRRNEGVGGAAPSLRLRADGTLMPRNALVGDPIHRVDMRIQKRFPIAGRVAIDGIVEVFNLFNHENYGSYVVNEGSSQYGKPSFNANVAYQPRIMQLGFRLTF